ncbi:hypothetical protein ACFSO7_17725 [Bacillus sp. CGMCC 1.16607]
MKELIGKCSICQKELFCLDGFFNGIILETKELLCFDCHNSITDDKKIP